MRRQLAACRRRKLQKQYSPLPSPRVELVLRLTAQVSSRHKLLQLFLILQCEKLHSLFILSPSTLFSSSPSLLPLPPLLPPSSPLLFFSPPLLPSLLLLFSSPLLNFSPHPKTPLPSLVLCLLPQLARQNQQRYARKPLQSWRRCTAARGSRRELLSWSQTSRACPFRQALRSTCTKNSARKRRHPYRQPSQPTRSL